MTARQLAEQLRVALESGDLDLEFLGPVDTWSPAGTTDIDLDLEDGSNFTVRVIAR